MKRVCDGERVRFFNCIFHALVEIKSVERVIQKKKKKLIELSMEKSIQNHFFFFSNYHSHLAVTLPQHTKQIFIFRRWLSVSRYLRACHQQQRIHGIQIVSPILHLVHCLIFSISPDRMTSARFYHLNEKHRHVTHKNNCRAYFCLVFCFLILFFTVLYASAHISIFCAADFCVVLALFCGIVVRIVRE